MKPAHRPARLTLLVTLAGLIAAASPALAAKRVLRIVLDGPVLEAPVEGAELWALFGAEMPKTLRATVKKIEKAADDSKIDGLALIIATPTLGPAQAEDLRAALDQFKRKGKPVYVYMDAAGNLGYLVASAASHVTLAETSWLETTGLNATTLYYKNLFEKIGVTAQMMHCGDFKSALEPYMRTGPSDEASQQMNWLLDGIYARYVGMIAKSRKLDDDAVKSAIDEAPLLADRAQELRLIDEVGDFAGFKKRLHKEFGQDVEFVKRYDEAKDGLELDFSNPFALFNVFQKMMEEGAESTASGPGSVGLIYVDGMIILGESSNDPLMGTVAGSTTIRAAIEAARLDPQVKSVVLRVDSPGGSALASDIMWHALNRLAEEKPLIVSMGNVAASGGYYVSVPADTIFAQDTTITGSIGVVGGKLVWQELMSDKLGITHASWQRGDHADLMSTWEPWDQDEQQWMLHFMNSTYETFKQRVKTGRGQKIDQDLESLAGGRVYTGRQALERGLVDKIGGLSDAIATAADKAGLTNYQVAVFPKEKGLEELFALLAGKETEDNWELDEVRTGPSAAAPRSMLASDPLLRTALPLLRELDPTTLGRIIRDLRAATLLQSERVECYLPLDIRMN